MPPTTSASRRRFEVKESAIGAAPETLSVAPISVNIYRFPVAQAAIRTTDWNALSLA